MGRKKVVHPEDESGNGDASLPRPKRAKQPTAKPPRNKRKVSAGHGKNSFRKAADDLYLPNVDVELVPVTEQLFTHQAICILWMTFIRLALRTILATKERSLAKGLNVHLNLEMLIFVILALGLSFRWTTMIQ